MNGKRFLVIGLSVALGGAGAAAFAGGGDDDKHKHKDKDTLGEQQPAEDPMQAEDPEDQGQAQGDEADDELGQDEDTTFATGTPRSAKNAEQIVSKWSEKPREVARTMIEKYGQPDESTPSMLIWHDNGPWKKTIVHKEGVPHNFPQPHTDIVEQFIDYEVPADKFDELAAYDGSVVARRTEGVISARCDDEAMNFLALNLADDLAKGEKDVETARSEYAQTAMKFMQAKKDMKAKGTKTKTKAAKKSMLPKETVGFTFEVAEGNTADPGEAFKAEVKPATEQPGSERQPATPRRY